MKATDFEYRHRTLLHLTVVLFAFLTYFIDRNDIVWALVREHGQARLLERAVFILATLLIGFATALRTWGRAHALSEGSESVFGRESLSRRLRYPVHVGGLLFAIGLGFLAPLPGFIFLVIAEAILVIRLIAREEATNSESLNKPPLAAGNSTFVWREAVRLEAGKWGLFVTMIVFTLLLNDRIAEVLGAGSFLLAIVLNYKSYCSAIAS
jgi:hypothetical protein